MSIITLEKYKLLANIPMADTENDDRITAFIDIIENDYLNIRNKAFDTVKDEETGEQVIIYPPGAEYTAFEMLQYKLNNSNSVGVVSESIGSYSYTLSGLSGAYPTAIVSKIKTWANSNVNRTI